ncbi:MAG: ATP-binding protein [Candidatus Synoicihabitans palmerolidicus]|nr:ATP-binding protein [Candidatus Synoicihabitans palmerolidicus]
MDAVDRVITSHKTFRDWGHAFASNTAMASAALDRLAHRSPVVNIKGDCYRMKENRLTGLFPGSVDLTATNLEV